MHSSMFFNEVINNFEGLSQTQKYQFEQIESIYVQRNAKLNLISKKDIENIYLKHVLHSLSIAKIVSLRLGARILDVGTGGGFPGIPLAIFFPQAHFNLIDSIGKKISAVTAIVKELNLSNVTLQNIRAEEIKGQYDFILGRAVADLKIFFNWVKARISTNCTHSIPNGVLYLRGDEPIKINIKHNVYNINTFFSNSFFASKKIFHLYL